MSLNWVMLSDADGFTPLPNEQRLYTSPPRTDLLLESIDNGPEREKYSVKSTGGCVHLTTLRVVYLPIHPTSQLSSFAAPILNLTDTHVAAPFFGPNVWTALVKPVAGGGLPTEHPRLQLKMTFKNGGAYDFHSGYERIKERLLHAVEMARERGDFTGEGDGSESGAGRGPGGLGGVDLRGVHLDELPAYEQGDAPQRNAREQRTEGQLVDLSPQSSPLAENFSPPAEPPPGYEEVQSQSVADALERRLRMREE